MTHFYQQPSWHYFATKESANTFASDYTIQNINWSGAAWYYVWPSSRRCPRGCCTDDVINIERADTRIREIQEEMLSLANKLKEAREKAKLDVVPKYIGESSHNNQLTCP